MDRVKQEIMKRIKLAKIKKESQSDERKQELQEEMDDEQIEENDSGLKIKELTTNEQVFLNMFTFVNVMR